MDRISIPRLDELIGENFNVLDHGYLRLIDYMGDDSSIVQAARVSYGTGTKTKREDEGLIRYLLANQHCYDDDTEVLTERGFVFWSDVKPDDLLGIWDRENETLVYEKPRELISTPYNGRMCRIDHGGVDLLVTPNHKMWVSLFDEWDADTKTQSYSPFRLVDACDIMSRSMVKFSKIAPYVQGGDVNEVYNQYFDGFNTLAVLRLIGFFVGDGTVYSTNAISFHLSKDRKIQYIMGLISDLGLEYRIRDNRDGTFSVVIYQDGIGSWFEHNCYGVSGLGKYKRLPQFCLRLNADDAKQVLDGLKNSDGHVKKDRGGEWRYDSSSSVLLDQVQILGIHAGYSCSMISSGNSMAVSFHTRKRYPKINQGKLDTSLEDYSGMVYCAHSRTGVLVVRRNGKVVLSGNSTPFEMCEIKVHAKMPIFVARQWVRHRTASINEYSARYSVLDKEYYVPSIKHLGTQSSSNKQGREEGAFSYEDGLKIQNIIKDHSEEAYKKYEYLLEMGVARELARMVLPLNFYTQWYWKIDLKNLLGFLALRMDSHAQYEVRVYADALAEIAKIWVPNVYRAYNDYMFKAVRLSKQQADLLCRIVRGELPEFKDSGISSRREYDDVIGRFVDGG